MFRFCKMSTVINVLVLPSMYDFLKIVFIFYIFVSVLIIWCNTTFEGGVVRKLNLIDTYRVVNKNCYFTYNKTIDKTKKW